jgi:hypothetical protein
VNWVIAGSHRLLIGPSSHHNTKALSTLYRKLIFAKREKEIVPTLGWDDLKLPFVWRYATHYSVRMPELHRTPSSPSLDLNVNREVTEGFSPGLAFAAIWHHQLFLSREQPDLNGN